MNNESVEKKPDVKIISVGTCRIVDLLAQINNLSVSLNEEINKSDDGGGITARALKTSIILTLFSILESFCNTLSKSMIKVIAEDFQDSSNENCCFNQIEIDFLNEQRTYVDHKKGLLKVQKSCYIPTKVKLSLYPKFFFKMHGLDYKLDKSGREWRSIIQLKKTRDRLIHPKIDDNCFQIKCKVGEYLDISDIKPSYSIDIIDVFNSVKGVRWYLDHIMALIEKVYNQRNANRQFLDLLCWMIMANLYQKCGITEKQFYKQNTMPKVKYRVREVNKGKAQ